LNAAGEVIQFEFREEPNRYDANVLAAHLENETLTSYGSSWI